MPFLRFPDPPEPPVPVSALFAGDVVDVEFDQLLVDGPLDVANWSVYHGGAFYSVIEAAAAENAVQLAVAVTGFGPGTEGVSYAADPADVIGTNGKPAEAFSNLPFS